MLDAQFDEEDAIHAQILEAQAIHPYHLNPSSCC